jgi:HAD superfamily hydrolase (TIGR01549 family)
MTVILFDLEGTLVQSVEGNKDAILEFRMKTASKLMELGIAASELEGIEVSTLMRNRALEIVDQHFKKEEARRFHCEMDKFLKTFELRWALQSRLFPDTLSTLCKLKKLRCKIGLVTNTSKEAANHMLFMHGIDSLFGVTVTREEVSRLKPDPEGIFLALKKFRERKFFFVGDLSYDALAAKKAGGVSIVVNRNPSKTLEFQADFIISSLEEIPNIIQESKT